MANSHVIKVSKETIAKMEIYYQGCMKSNTPQYSSFSAKKGSVTITAYTSGKVMFQGPDAEKEATQWGGELTNQTKKSTSTSQSSLPKGFENWSVVGSDEVGNGSYFGPVVVCAAYASKDKLELLKELGVKDSKELTDPQIRKIAKDIKFSIPYHQLIVTPEKYNVIQPEYNVNRMKVALHNQAIYLLLQDLAPVKPEAILIDQFTPEANYRKHLAREKNKVPGKIYFATKGEQHHLAVAAASIICRDSFLESLEAASRELGFTVPSGAGPKSDDVAARVLKIGGLPLLGKHAKLHFANTQKAQRKLR